MIRVGHVARIEDTRIAIETLKEKYHLGGLGADGRILLKWILRE
jgi:hypothetical protein